MTHTLNGHAHTHHLFWFLYRPYFSTRASTMWSSFPGVTNRTGSDIMLPVQKVGLEGSLVKPSKTFKFWVHAGDLNVIQQTEMHFVLWFCEMHPFCTILWCPCVVTGTTRHQYLARKTLSVYTHVMLHHHNSWQDRTKATTQTKELIWDVQNYSL